MGIKEHENLLSYMECDSCHKCTDEGFQSEDN